MAQEHGSGSGLDFDGAFEDAFGAREDVAAPEALAPVPDAFPAQEEPPLPELDFDGAFEDVEAERFTAEDNRLRTIFTIAQDGTADSQTRALEISRAMGVPVEMVEEHLQGWESAWRESQFDPAQLRETHPGHVDFILRQPPRVAATVVRNEGWFMSLGRRLGAALEHLARSTVTPEPSVPGAADLLPSDFREDRDNLLPTQDEREAALQQSGAETLETITGPRRTMTLEEHPDAEGMGTAGRIGAAWGDARRQDEVSKLGFQLMTARSLGHDTRDIENRLRRLQLTPTTRFYGQSLLEQPLIDATTLAASQFESLKAGGAGGVLGAAGGGLVGALSRNPGAARTLARIGWKTGGQAGTVGSSFLRESGGAYVEFSDAQTDEGEALSHEAATGGAILYGVVASALELDALSSFLGSFGPIGDAIREGTGKTVVREMLQKNPAFRHLARDIFKRWGRGALGEAKEEGLQSIAQDLSEWLAKSAQAGNLQEFDLEETIAQASDAAGTAFTGMTVMGSARAAPALVAAGHQSLTADPGGAPPGQALAETQRRVTEHRQSVAAGRQVEVLAQAAGERSDAIRAAPEAVAEYIGQETEASGEPVTHLYVDATAMARLYQSGTPGPDGITQEAAQAAEQLLGEGGAETLREAVATGGRIEVPLADYLDRWGAVQVEAPTPTDSPVGEGASPTPQTGRRSIAEALARDTTTRPGLMLPSQVDPALLEQVERDAQKLAREMEADQRQADSVVESRFTDALTEQLVATRTFTRAEARQVATLARAFVRTQAQRFGQPVEALFSDYSLLVERGRPGEWADVQFPFGLNAPVPLASRPEFTRTEDIETIEAEDAKIRASVEAHAAGVGDLHDSIVRMEERAAAWKSEEKKETLRKWIAYARGEVDREPDDLRRDVVREAIAEGVVPSHPGFRWEEWVADTAEQLRGRRVVPRKRKGVSQYDMRDAEREGTTGRFTGRFAKRLSQGPLSPEAQRQREVEEALESAWAEASPEERVALYYRDATTGALHERAIRDIPMDPEAPLFGGISFGFKKTINDKISHEALNNVFRAVVRALLEQTPLVAKVGGDIWIHGVRDQAEINRMVEAARVRANEWLPPELHNLPFVAVVAPRVEGEDWTATKHRVGDAIGAESERLRGLQLFPQRLGPGSEPAVIPSSVPTVEHSAADVPASIREIFAGLSDYDAAMDVFVERPTGMLTKAGWDEVRKRAPADAVASGDVRAVAAMDKRLGHLSTDQIIEMIGRHLARKGGGAWSAAHVSGDEFMFQGPDPEGLGSWLKEATDELASTPLWFLEDGADPASGGWWQDGLHLAYGIATGPNAEQQADGIELPAVKDRAAADGRSKEWYAERTERIDGPTLAARIRSLPRGDVRGSGAAGVPGQPGGFDLRGLAGSPDTRAGATGTRLNQSVPLLSGEETREDFFGDSPPERAVATLREMAEAFDERTREKWGALERNDFSPEAEERFAGWMADEVAFELRPERAPTSGAGWYTTKWDAAIDAISEIFPEIKEPNQRAIFTALMAITSDGQAVPRNFDLAIEHFGHYRENGRLPGAPLSGMGTGTAAFARNLATLQELIDIYGDGLRDHLTQEVEWRHIRASIVEAGGKDPGSAYEADARLPAAAGYFGPKLGAFLANLSGSQGYLTMDRWFMRTANRYRGTLASSATQKGKDRVKALLGRPRMRDATLMREIAPIVKEFAARGYKNGSEFEKAANTVWKDATGLNDAPRGARERSFLIRTVRRARDVLAERGHDVSVSDVQAILWYYEKSLYGEISGQDRARGVSYAEAARDAVARVRGEGAGPVGSRVGEAEGVPGRAGAEEGGGRDGEGDRGVETPDGNRLDGARLEQSQAGEESLETIREEARAEGVKLDVYEHPSRIALPRIVVPEDLRGTGIGTRFMQRLIDYADRVGKPIALTPSTDFGASSKARLTAFYRRLGFVENKGRNRDFGISESMYRPPRLHQDETAAAGAAPRGSIDFLTDEMGGRVFRVLLNPGSDRSTILHELGHGFLEMFGDLAERPDAPESVRQDWARTLEFLGVGDRNGIQVAEHEKWARAFEAYLFEGKAPSKALSGAFARFKQWLRGIYRTIRSLNVELNDEIRGVFDRLLASEEETARARAKSGLMPLFRSPEDAGMSPEAWEAYQRAVERSVSNAEFRAERVGYEEAQRELEGWWKEEKTRRKQDAEREYEDLPGVRAWRYLRTGQAWWIPEGAEPDAPPKLDRAAVQRLVGEGVDVARRFPGITEPGGVHPDDVAVVLGIPSGQQMFEGILNRPDRRQWVADRAEAMMREAHPDVLRERERLEAAAQEALHAAPTSDWLLKEWAELRRKSGQQGAPPVESIRRAAQILAERRTLREVTPGRVLQQERSAAEKAALLTARGEFAQAYVAKQQQLLNHYLWRELTQAKRERESFEGLLDQAEGDAWRGRLGLADEGRVLRDFSDTVLAWLGTRPRQEGERAPSVVELQQVLGTLGLEAAFDVSTVERLLQSPPLESVDSRARLDSPAALALLEELYGAEVALKARDPRTGGTSVTRIQKTLREALPRGQGAQAIRDVRELLRQRGAVVDAPESVATWTSITVAEMRELSAALKQVSKAATDAQTALDEGRRVAIEELAGEILADSMALPRKAPPPRSEATKSWAQRASQRWEGIRSEMIDPEEMFRRLGPTAHRFFWDGYLKQRTLEQDMARDVMAVFDRIWTDLPQAMKDARHDIVAAPEIPFSPDLAREGPITREQVWMIAANMGNEGNMQRLLDGYGWERGQVMALLDRVMTREEWEFIQGVWDLMDRELWPRMAEAFEAQNGIRPPKVEATPVVTRHGVFRGGYFPARYDPIESRRGGAQLLEGAANLFSDPSVRASVTKGFTKSRAERVKDVVSLEWGHVPQHVAKVIHFTAFGQWVLEAGRVLANPTLTRAADQALGFEYRQQLEAWLKAVANPGALNAAEGVKNVARLMGAGRSFFVTTTLGYSATVAMGDLTNPLVAVASGDVKARFVGGSMATFVSNPARFVRDAQALSPELRHRADNMMQHIRREMGDVGGDGRRTPLRRVREHAFSLFGLTDAMTASIVWDGARRQRLAQGLPEAEAAKGADEVVRSLFPAVTAAEQPALLRDKHGVGALLAFFSYFSKIENRIRREWHGPLADFALARGAPETMRALLGLAGPAGRTLAIFAVTGVLAELLSGRGPDEEEEWDEWFTRKLVSAPFSLIPMMGAAGEHAVGRVTSYLWQGEAKGRTFSARAAPFASFLERIQRAAETTFTSEDEEKRAWAAVELMLSALGLPASQPLRTGRYLTDVIQGEAERDPVSGVLYGEREQSPKGPAEAVGDLVGR